MRLIDAENETGKDPEKKKVSVAMNEINH